MEVEHVLQFAISIVFFWKLTGYWHTELHNQSVGSKHDHIRFLLPATVHSFVVSLVTIVGLYSCLYDFEPSTIVPYDMPSWWISNLLAFSVGYYVVEAFQHESVMLRVHVALCIVAFGTCLLTGFALFFAAIRLLSQISNLFWNLREWLLLRLRSRHIRKHYRRWIDLLTILAAASYLLTRVVVIRQYYKIALRNQHGLAHWPYEFDYGFWLVNLMFDVWNALFFIWFTLPKIRTHHA